MSDFPVTEKRNFDTSICCHFGSSLGTEELGHMEMISAIVYQLTKNMTIEEIKKSGFDTYFVDQSTGI